jgi:hypothetical protein
MPVSQFKDIIQGDHGDAKNILLAKDYRVIEWDK